MARDRIKSRASFKSEVWTGKRESVELGRTEVPWPNRHDADLESSELVSGGESGFVRIEGAWHNSGPADDVIPFGSPVSSSIAAEGSSKLPSSDLMMCSGSKARAVVGAAVGVKTGGSRVGCPELCV